MTLLERTDQKITSEKPETAASGSDQVESHTLDKEGAASSKHLITGSQGLLIGLAFVVGLLLGWIVIGWWLWPVKWNNSEPWLLRPELQEMYVELVAEDYWHSKDLSRAREALAGWDEESLTELLATLQAQASTPEKRQHLATLAQALTLPDPNKSLLTSLLNQRMLVLSAVLSVSPLVAALVLGVFPLVQDRTKKKPKELDLLGQGVEELEEELDGLLSRDEEQRVQDEQRARAKAGVAGVEEGDDTPEEGLEEGGASEEWEDETGEEDSEAEGDDWLDEEGGEEGQTMENIFADVFHEEDETFADLEALCKDLPDVNMDELAKKSAQTIDQLVRSSWLR